jgi:hypothetical protein
LSKLAEKRGDTKPNVIYAAEKVQPEQFYKRDPIPDDEGLEEHADKTVDNT